MYQQFHFDSVAFTVECAISEIIAGKCENILYSSPVESEE